MNRRPAPAALALLSPTTLHNRHVLSAYNLARLLTSVVAAMVAILGLFSILAALLVHNSDRVRLLNESIPLYVPHLSRTISVIDGLCLILLARGLHRRKRQAWLLTLVLLVISMPAQMLKDLDIEEALGAAIVCLMLVSLRRFYTVRSDPQTLRRGYKALGIALLLPCLYSLIGMTLLREQFQPRPDFWSTVLGGFNLLLGDSQVVPQTHRAVWFLHSTIWLSGASLLYGVFAVLRPVLSSGRPHSKEREIAEANLATYGVNPISPYALDSDKSIYIGPDRAGVVAYAVASGVAVVAGDPIGPIESRDDLLDSFVDWCHRHDWLPAFYETMQDENARYRQRGYRLLKVGEDALIDLATFTLSGKKIANVRHCVTHCERAGLSVQVYDGQSIDEHTLIGLESISTAWMNNKSGGEMGFSLGSFSRATLQQSAVAVARDEAGVPIAFATFRHFGGTYGVVLDLMRRAADVPSGTMDYLIAQALVHFQAAGITVASLGLAPLANTRNGEGQGWLENRVGNGMEWIFNNMNGVYRYKSLYFFKRKFNPRWESRYLAYPGGAALPHVLYALLRVHLPSALVSLPSLARLPGQREMAGASPSAPAAGGRGGE